MNSDTTIVSAPTSLTIPEGASYSEITLQTFGVAADQIVRITFFGGEIPASALITIQPANLASSAALTDSGCTVGDIDGFRKKFLAGVPILFGMTLDGQAPPAGASVKITSSRPDIFPLPSSSLQFAPFARDTMLVLTSSVNITSPQRVVITSQYRSRIVFDTIIILQKPQYSYAILPARFQSAEVYDFNNRGEILFRGKDSLNFIWHDGVETAVPANLTKMNDSGWVAGYQLGDDSYMSRAAIFKNGTTFIIPNPNSEFTRSFGKAINNLRHVALYSERATFPYGPSKFTIWENGAMTDPGSIGEYWLDPTDINDNGIVVGTGYQSGNFNIPYRIPFVWDGDTLSRVPIPPDWNGEGIAVNKSGVIVGNIPPWGFLFDQGVLSMILFPPPFGRGQVFDMNDSGVVVGSMQKYLGELWGEPSAFVFRDGLLYDLNCVASLPSGLKLTSATKINNAGDIIGEVRDGKTFLQSYLLRQGNVTDVRTDMPVKEIPTQYLLAQNYPNPFNPTTSIRFDIPTASRVTLKLFNVLGQEVATLVQEEKVAGSYEAQWNADRFSSGVYFYRLTAGSFTSVKKMLLLK